LSAGPAARARDDSPRLGRFSHPQSNAGANTTKTTAALTVRT